MALMARKGQVKPNDRPSPGPKGNTEGPVLPETSPNASGAGNSAPPPKPPEEKKGWWKSWGSDVTHGALDVVGVIPVVGEPFNLIGAGVYVLEGDYVSAGLDLAAMWPAGGQAATVTKYGAKGTKAVVEQVEKKAAKEVEAQAAEAAGSKAGKEAAEASGEKAAKASENASGGGYVNGPKKRSPRKPNREKWEKEGGTVKDHPDGSTTYTRKDGTSVTYNKEGYPDFSKHSVAEVKIDGLKGQYGPDEKIANKAIGLDKTPDNYVWHHVEDGKTMQLVPKDIHAAFPHTGGASVIRGGG